MSLPEFSVRRPVTVFMITVAVTIFGFLCAQMLPVELLPDFPQEWTGSGDGSNGGRYTITYICTFASDEPYQEVIKASLSLPSEIVINFSGSFKNW